MAKSLNLLQQEEAEGISLSELDQRLKEKQWKIIFLFDGLENQFSGAANEKTQQIALQALIDLPENCREIRNPNLGMVIFLHHDFLPYALSQNIGQFESLYKDYHLTWEEESFLKLVYWLIQQIQLEGFVGRVC